MVKNFLSGLLLNVSVGFIEADIEGVEKNFQPPGNT
jgi:hypothetical protein